MTNREAVAVLRSHTMACWWPSRAWPGITDWPNIVAEARLQQRGILDRQQIRGVPNLSPDDSETAIYHAIENALQTVANREAKT